MVKRIAAFVAVLLMSSALFASTPTGTVVFTYAVGACPQVSFQNWDTTTLDVNGKYSLPSANLAGLDAGSYCFKDSYSGDATHNPSVETVTLVVATQIKVDTTTTIIITPNPLLVGQGGTISGSVQ